MQDRKRPIAHRHRLLLGLRAMALAAVCCGVWVTNAQAVSLAPDTPSDAQKVVPPRVFGLDAQTSLVQIYAFRGGAAARMGHNHVLSVPKFEGQFAWHTDQPTRSSFDLRFRLDDIAFDLTAHRGEIGGAFASTITDDARESTRRNMLGERSFDAERFPFVSIRSLQIAGESPKFAVRVAVEMHGHTQEYWIAMTVHGLPDHLQAKGTWVLRQSDFGVQPFSVLGGFLTVQDAFIIEFALQGRELETPDQPKP